MMGSKRGKGGLSKGLDDSSTSSSSNNNKISSLNQGRGQEITGISLPPSGKYDETPGNHV